MRRGYTVEAYLSLVQRARDVIDRPPLLGFPARRADAPAADALDLDPWGRRRGGGERRVSFSSDFIAGFCGETEEEHEATLALINEVGYDMAYLFAYSLREKTHAHRSDGLADDVPPEVKKRRLGELISAWRSDVGRRNHEYELFAPPGSREAGSGALDAVAAATTATSSSTSSPFGRSHLVLVEGSARKQGAGGGEVLTGRTDSNKRIVFTASPLAHGADEGAASPAAALAGGGGGGGGETGGGELVLRAGDYAEVAVSAVTGHTLRGRALRRSSIADWEAGLQLQLQR
jgi:hypothetical protein